MHVRAKVASAAIAAVAIGGTAALSVPSASAHRKGQIEHVLLISVDGMHQSDLDWYIANHPGLGARRARLRWRRVHQQPHVGPVGLRSGRHRADDRRRPARDRRLLRRRVQPRRGRGGRACTPGQPATGGDVIYDSPDDTLNAVPDLLNNGSGNTFPSFDEGGSIYPDGVDKNPGVIMNLTAHPQSGLNPGSFPVDPNDLSADHAVGLPEGQHDLPGDPQRRPAHGLV